MAEVAVDTETGIVKVTKMAAVQDCGLIIDVKMAESSVLGALIMGISYSLYEEKVMDPAHRTHAECRHGVLSSGGTQRHSAN